MRSKLNLLMVLAIALLIGYTSLSYISPASTHAQGIDFSYIAHFAFYFLLAGSLLVYFHDSKLGHLEATSIAFSYGLILELIQLNLIYRSFSTLDIFLNGVGACLIFLDHDSKIISRVVSIEDQILEKYFL